MRDHEDARRGPFGHIGIWDLAVLLVKVQLAAVLAALPVALLVLAVRFVLA
jgi:hypothetical protein